MITARAAVIEAPNSAFVVQSVELDDPQPDEILVKLTATGLCHTDLGVRAGGLPFPLPGVIGHEGAGVVERVGSSITTVAPGDKVLLSFTSCGACDNCAAGHPAYCLTWFSRNILSGAREDGSSPIRRSGRSIGGHFFGQSSFAEYAIADERSVVKVGPEADLRMLAPLGCGVQTGFGSIWNVLAPPRGASVAVFGAGAVGLSAIVAAHLAGADPIIAIDVVPARLELARELGATDVINGRTENTTARIAEITGPRGLLNAFDTTGNPVVMRGALDSLGVGGTLAYCGAPPTGTEFAVDIQGLLFGKRIIGITMGDTVPQDLLPQLVALHAEGKLPLEKIVKHYTLDDIEQAAQDMHHGVTVKPVILF
jgi:aryl-alcohol dehydrogenase